MSNYYVPNDILLCIVTEIVNSDHPQAYTWSPSVRSMLVSLSLVDRALHDIVNRFLYLRIVIYSRSDIHFLLRRPSYLARVESLALLSGRVDWNTGQPERRHGYCLADVQPLLDAVAPKLHRFLLVHSGHHADRNCGLWLDAVSGLVNLRELIAVDPWSHFPRVVIDEEEGDVDINDYRHHPQDVRDDRSNDDERGEDPTQWVSTWPTLRSLVKLATWNEDIWWRDFRYAHFFPQIEKLVLCDSSMEDWEAQFSALRKQMRGNRGLKVVFVLEDNPHIRTNYEDVMERVPADRCLFETHAQGDGWFMRNALQGGIFDDIGRPLTAFPRSEDEDEEM